MRPYLLAPAWVEIPLLMSLDVPPYAVGNEHLYLPESTLP